MKMLALLCNIGLLLFTCFVLLTDGPPREGAYIVFTVWALLTLMFSAVVISRSGASDRWLGQHGERTALEEQNRIDGGFSKSGGMNVAAVVGNIVFFGFVCWALVDQYPHPQEPGFIPFVVLMVLTPIFNVVVLFRSRTTRLQATPGSRLG